MAGSLAAGRSTSTSSMRPASLSSCKASERAKPSPTQAIKFLGGEHGVVQIDGPGQYHAQTDLGYGEIFLEGLKATSYSLKTDLLSLYKGNMLVDQVHLGFLGTASNFGVSQVGGSVVIHADGSSYKDGGVLLAHHA